MHKKQKMAEKVGRGKCASCTIHARKKKGQKVEKN